MVFYPDERIALFIDGANLHSATKSLDFDIDYKRMLDFFRGKSRLIAANYYTAVLEHADYSPLKPLIDWLNYNGYHVITKPAREQTDREGRRHIKGNMDIEMVIDMLERADTLDHIVLFTGDGDFKAAIAAVQRKGVRVSVVSTLKSSPPMLSDELRRQADEFIDLSDLDMVIGRDTDD